MNTRIKRAVAGTVLATMILSGAAGAYAMSDEDFQKQILEQIKVEENLSADELAEISEQLQDISREDILASLLEEINHLEDEAFKKEMTTKFESIKKVTDGGDFFDVLDDIYGELDEYYAENFGRLDIDETIDWEYNFEEEKKFILESLKEELKYTTEEAIKKEVEAAIAKLEKETDEDKFFDILDEVYESINEHYGIDDEFDAE